MSHRENSELRGENEINLSHEVQPGNAVWNSTEGVALLLESAPIAISAVNRSGHILFVNAKLEEMFGYQRHELIGQKVEILMPERFRQTHEAHRDHYMNDLRVRPMGSGLNLIGRHKNGEEFPIEVGLSFTKIQGEILVIGSIANIAIRQEIAEILERRVEERTREIERRRRLADGLRDTLAMLNSNRSLREILDHIVAQAVDLLHNARACAVYRLSEEERLFTIQTSYGLPRQYIAQANVPMDEGTIGEVMFSRQPVAISNVSHFKGVNPSSRMRRQALLDSGYYAFLAVPLTIKEEVYGALVLYYAEPGEFSTEEIELAVTFSDQAALAIENARLRAQAEHAAVVAERSRLARDLHDSVTQTLFSASLIAEVLPRLWRGNRDEGLRRLQELRQLTRGALAEMRTLLLELRPSRVTESELGDLLRQLADAATGRARIPVEVKTEGERMLPPEVQVALYRITQEALNNIVKHARASKAVISLNSQRDKVTLTVHDDGIGFSFNGIAPDNLGLSIMQERAEAIEATLEIHPIIDQGTDVTVVWSGQNETI